LEVTASKTCSSRGMLYQTTLSLMFIWSNVIGNPMSWFDFKKKGKTADQELYFHGPWPDYVVTLDDNNFKEFITKYPLSLVDFWAAWCAPCREMAPRLRRLSKIYKGEIAFGKLDIQTNDDIAKEYKIMGIPHCVVFKNGKKISSITGVKSIGEMKETIDALLKKIK
jgi:thioredoxin 1